VRELQKQTAEIIRRLSFNETVMLRDILKKRDVSSKPEHKLIRKLISQLPQKAISFLYGLTELNEEDTASIFQPLQKHSYVHSRDSSISENYISSGNKFYIDNGGLCLLAPYLPNLFSNLKLLENKKFKSIIAAQKATHLLEYMCCGEKEFPEYQLQFNKILCGFNITDPLYGKIRLSRKDIHEANALLESVINNWPALKHTSVEGLQNTFLKRKAILTNEEQYWVLQVEKKGYDVLLDTDLWGFNIIHFPWMQKYITVEW
jgi:hypothetical protein